MLGNYIDDLNFRANAPIDDISANYEPEGQQDLHASDFNDRPIEFSPPNHPEYSEPRYTSRKELEAEFNRAQRQQQKALKQEEQKQEQAEVHKEQESFETDLPPLTR